MSLELLPMIAELTHTRISCHAHNTHELFLCIGGRGRQGTDTAEYACGKGDLFFFARNQPHGACAAGEESHRGMVIHFGNDWVRGKDGSDAEAAVILDYLCRQASSGCNRVPLTPFTVEVLGVTMNEILEEFNNRRHGYHLAFKSLLLKLLTQILRDDNVYSGVEVMLREHLMHSTLNHVFSLVDIEFYRKITVDEAAAAACMSRSHFHAVFRQETGYTFVEYLNKIRVEKARHLLAATDMTIIQVAIDCGFPSLSRFYAVFTDTVGRSPKNYRIKP